MYERNLNNYKNFSNEKPIIKSILTSRQHTMAKAIAQREKCPKGG